MAEKGKCKKSEALQRREGQDKTCYSVAFEGGKDGLTFDSFTVGEEYEYETRDKENSKGGITTWIWKPKQRKGGYQKDTLGTIIGTGASYAVNLYNMEPFATGKMDVIMDVIIKAMAEKHKEVNTDREKGFVSYAMKYAIDVYKTDIHRERFQKAKKQDGTKVDEELGLIVAIFQQILKNMLDASKALS